MAKETKGKETFLVCSEREEEGVAEQGSVLARGCQADNQTYLVLYLGSWGRHVNGRGVILPVKVNASYHILR